MPGLERRKGSGVFDLEKPAWFLVMWGPDVDWAFVQREWFWAVVFLKFSLWLMAFAVIWLTLWARQLRKQVDGR